MSRKGPEGDARGGASRGSCGRNGGGDDGLLILAALSAKERGFDCGIARRLVVGGPADKGPLTKRV